MITAADKLSILENFSVDRTLPKFRAKVRMDANYMPDEVSARKVRADEIDIFDNSKIKFRLDR